MVVDVLELLNYLQMRAWKDPAFADLSARYVPGDGSLDAAKLIFVGEAPGATEERLGRPFVGKSGRFLSQLLRAPLGVARAEIYITNVVKFRPPENRDPTPEEIEAGLRYLRREIALVGGESGCRTIVGLGRIACGALLGEATSVGRSHGSVLPLGGSWSLFVSYHPSWAIRSPANKAVMSGDFEKLRYMQGRLWG